MEATLQLLSTRRTTERSAGSLLELADGSREALASLYSDCSERWFGLALWITGDREEAADAVHDAVVKIWRYRRSVATARSPHAYALQVVRSVALDRVRRQPVTEPLEDLVLPVEPVAESKAEAARLSRLVGRLPEAQRSVVYLRHFADLRFREIGEAMDISTFTAASRYRLGMARLRRWLS